MNTLSTPLHKRSVGAVILAIALVAGVIGYHCIQPDRAHAGRNLQRNSAG